MQQNKRHASNIEDNQTAFEQTNLANVVLLLERKKQLALMGIELDSKEKFLKGIRVTPLQTKLSFLTVLQFQSGVQLRK